ncbi:ATP-binding cassette domain-containing protein [Atopobiaceae bacterium 24-176]
MPCDEKRGAAARLEGVRFSYDGGATWALDGVDLTVARGERLCLLGANGSGKSTLALLLAGISAPDAGEVELMGHACFKGGQADGAAYAQARSRISMVFQNPDDQIVTTRVEDDVAFGPENLGWLPERIEKVVARELDRAAMTDYAQADPSLLSGGQQQRVAIAGALAMEPDLLVLDEPGARLDVRGRAGVARVIEGLGGHATVVHVTHFMDEAAQADRVVVMDRGRIALEGSPDEVLEDPRLEGLSLEAPFTVRLARELRCLGVNVGVTLDGDKLALAVAREVGR